MAVTVFERKKGSGVYYLRIYHQGKKIIKKVGSYAQADKTRILIKAQIEQNGDLFLEKKKYQKKEVPSLNIMIESYLVSRTKRLTESSLVAYRGAFNTHVKESIGRCPVDSIEQGDIIDFLNSIAVGISRSSVDRVCYLMRKGFALAKIKKYISNIPTDGVMEWVNVEKRSTRLEKNKVFYIDEVQQILDTADAYRPRYASLFRFLAFTGCRLGEAIALTWDDISANGKYAVATANMPW